MSNEIQTRETLINKFKVAAFVLLFIGQKDNELAALNRESYALQLDLERKTENLR